MQQENIYKYITIEIHVYILLYTIIKIHNILMSCICIYLHVHIFFLLKNTCIFSLRL